MLLWFCFMFVNLVLNLLYTKEALTAGPKLGAMEETLASLVAGQARLADALARLEEKVDTLLVHQKQQQNYHQQQQQQHQHKATSSSLVAPPKGYLKATSASSKNAAGELRSHAGISTTNTSKSAIGSTASTKTAAKASSSLPAAKSAAAKANSVRPAFATRSSAASAGGTKGPTDRKTFLTDDRTTHAARTSSVEEGVHFWPMKGTVYAPSAIDVKSATEKAGMPTHNLVLEHVLGYRGKDMMGNVHALTDNRACWIAAGTGVVSDAHGCQSFFTHHDDDVMSIAVHPNRSYVATGQLAAKPSIMVWDSTAVENDPISVLRGGHERAVVALAFSPGDGQLLISVGRDDNNTVCMWDWASASSEPLLSVRGGQDRVLHVQALDEGCFVTSGARHARFWHYPQDVSTRASVGGEQVLTSKKGVLESKSEIQNIFAVCRIPSPTKTAPLRCVTGGSTGDICTWNPLDGKCLAAMAGHEGSVFALCPWSDGFVSGGKDGAVKVWRSVWNGAADTMPVFTLLSTTPLGSGWVRGIALVEDESAHVPMLATVGTSDNSVFRAHLAVGDQTSKIGPLLLTSGHTAELWGLAIRPPDAEHPDDVIFASSGCDKTVKVFRCGATGRFLLAAQLLDCESRACDFRFQGDMLAVGGCDGQVHIFSFNLTAHSADLALIATKAVSGQARAGKSSPRGSPNSPVISSSGGISPPSKRMKSKVPTALSPSAASRTGGKAKVLSTVSSHDSAAMRIDQVRFSPNGEFLAVCTHEQTVVVLSKEHEWAKVAICRGHTSFVSQIDWSEDSLYLHTNSGDYEHCVWNALNGTQITRAEAMRDIQWHDWTLPFGWPTEGIWGDSNDGTDVNAVAKSHGEDSFLVTGDDFARVNLFRFPALGPNAPHYRYRGHASHVTNVRVAYDNSRVVSAGGMDGCLMVWRVEKVSTID